MTISLGTVLLIVLILVLIGALPTWPYSREWGNGPAGVLGVSTATIRARMVKAGMAIGQRGPRTFDELIQANDCLVAHGQPSIVEECTADAVTA